MTKRIKNENNRTIMTITHIIKENLFFVWEYDYVRVDSFDGKILEQKMVNYIRKRK